MDPAASAVKLVPVDSELFQSVGYEDLTHTLYLKLPDGEMIRLQKVPRFRFTGLLSAPRKDAYYKTFIKDQFLPKPS
jgi:hypothetical protein